MSGERLNRLGQAAFLKTGGSVATALVSFVGSVILNRTYGKETYGLLVIVYTVIALGFAVSDLGAKATLTRFLPLWVKEGRQAEVGRLVAASVFIQLAGIAAFGLLLAGTAKFIAEALFLQPSLTTLLMTGCFYFAWFALFDFVAQTFQALQDWYKDGLLSLLFGGGQILSVCLVSQVFHGDIGWVLVGNGVAAACAVLAGVAWLPAHIRAALWSPDISKVAGELRTVIQFGSPLTIQGFYRFIVTWFDKILLGRFVTPGELGLYYVASTFLNGLVSLSKVLSTIFAPYVAEISDLSVVDLRRKFGLMFRWYLQAGILGSLVVFFAVEPIVLIMYGPSYEPVILLTRVLLLVFLLRLCRDPFAIFLTYALSKVGTVVTLGTVLTATVVISTATLVPIYGMWGAVCSTVIGQSVTWGTLLMLAPSLRTMVPIGSLWATVGGLVGAGGAYIVLGQFAPPVTLLGMASLLCYILALIASREIRSDDLRIARCILRTGHRMVVPSGTRAG